MGSFMQRKDGALMTISTIIDMDDDIGRKAFAALDRAERVSVDDLARHGDPSTKRF
jgi:hypothetical protein